MYTLSAFERRLVDGNGAARDVGLSAARSGGSMPRPTAARTSGRPRRTSSSSNRRKGPQASRRRSARPERQPASAGATPYFVVAHVVAPRGGIAVVIDVEHRQVVHEVLGAAPCQCSSPGSKNTRSPARMTSIGPPRRRLRPTPSRDPDRLAVGVRVPRGARARNVPDARLVEPTDALVAVTRACICGSDLWPYKSMEPSETGRIGWATSSSASSRPSAPMSGR